MSEVREQASHAATLGVQRGKILERNRVFPLGHYLRRVRLHTQLLRLPLAATISMARILAGRFQPVWVWILALRKADRLKPVPLKGLQYLSVACKLPARIHS
jgi:hypothetical protein